MTQTKLMQADDVAVGFNSVTERQYWKAVVGGTRVNPEVHFNSRATMVRVTYRVTTNDFTVTFSKSAVAFGDYLASAHRALAQVMTCLKAAGLPVAAPVDETGVFRLEYQPRTKTTAVHLAALGDDWMAAEPPPIKPPQPREPNTAESV